MTYISICINADCCLSNQCHRFKATPGIDQSYCDFKVISTKNECEYFIPDMKTEINSIKLKHGVK